MRKIVLVICDGMADVPNPKLENKTPLEYAEHPTLDEIASNGLCGLMDPVSPGVPPSSHLAHLAIFGYDPYNDPGRGLFEASGYEISLRDNQLAFRINLATVEQLNNALIVRDRRAGRIESNQAKKLIEFLNDEIKCVNGFKVKFIHTSEHRGILWLKALMFLEK